MSTDDGRQVVGDRWTGVVLVVTTALATYGLWRLTEWDYRVWWRAGALLVGGYLVAAVALLGINQFAAAVHRETQRLR